MKNVWPADKVERRSVAKLLPYAKNARTHSDEQVRQIARSIEEFGFTNPVLVDEDGTIIAGHGRVLAAKSLKLRELPVMVAVGWSDAQRRAYVIADNKLALNAGWDENLLRDELQALGEMGFDLPLTGFDGGELTAALAFKNAGLTDPDEAPEPPVNPASRLGDLWLLGRHRVLCGDATSITDASRLVGDVTPSLANCDPPYGIKIVRGSTDGGAKPFGKVGGWKDGDRNKGPARKGRVHGPAKNAIIQPGVYAPIIGDDSTDTAHGAYAVLVALGVPSIVLWGGNYFADKLPASRCWLVWDKENTGSFGDAEIAWTNQDRVVQLLRHQWSGLIKASERGQRRVHPTQKPVALAEWVIETIAPSASSVIDLFLGSGSTLIACEHKRIACLGMELSPAYCDVIVKRWQDFTGETATLDGDGRTFADIDTERYQTGENHRNSAECYDAAIAARREKVSAVA